MLARKIHSSFAPSQVRHFENFNPDHYKGLTKIGIDLNNLVSAMDSIQPTITTGSMAVPAQFLQAWMPGFVYTMTGPRKIDLLTGIMTIGDWEDEETVQGVLERTGTSVPYGDNTNIPLSSWNTNFERRTIVRFEEGLQVGALEAARSAKMQVDDAGTKRSSAALALDIIRNSIGFNGYNAGDNRTYGFLNDPGLPNYITVPNGASGFPEWSKKDFLEIARDIRLAAIALQTQTQGLIDPENSDLVLAIATNSVGFLSVTTSLGYSVRQWIKETYPKMRIESAPQLNAANGGANVFYLYAEKIVDESTDGGLVFVQMVPTKFKVMGVQQLVKKYEEDYSNATAGVECKRPWAVVRRSGI